MPDFLKEKMTIIEKYFNKNTPEKKVYEFIANILLIKDLRK